MGAWDKENIDRTRGTIWLFKAWTIYAVLVYLAMIIAIPVEHLARYGLYSEFPQFLTNYFGQVFTSGGTIVFKYLIFFWGPSLVKDPDVYHIIPLIPLMIYPFAKLFIDNMNPYDMFIKSEGTSRKADYDDLKKWGMFDGFIFVLGKFKGKYLKLKETYSVLACAPPGTGKTTAIVIPTMLECDDVSMIVNDPKPELCYQTSAYRATKSVVFTLNFSEQDDPENGIYYPSWNPLSPDAVPPMGPLRDMYVDSMCAVLVNDKGGKGDPHWTKSGRNALTGLIHFLVSKCERARASDYFAQRLQDKTFDTEDARLLEGYYASMKDNLAMGALNLLRDGLLTAENYVPVGTWSNIPENWVGHEACLPLLLDWMTESQLKVSDQMEKRKQQGDSFAAMGDSMKEIFKNSANEARQYGYAYRAVQEMTQLANTPDKERGSVLSTALTEVGIFKNAAVRERTAVSDFSFQDLRGMYDPRDGKVKPVTIYVSMNTVDAKALSTLTGVFIELMSNFLISNPPGKVFRGKPVGPFATLFILDEFPTMPKLEAVIQGPAVGRGQKVSYLLIAQDLGQISAGYGKDAVETLFSTTYAKIILAQNNENTANRFAEMMGKRTVITRKPNENYESVFNLKKKEEPKGINMYSGLALMGLDPKKQVVITQGNPTLPIEATAPRWFEHDDLKAKVEMGAAPALPEFLIESHKEQLKHLQKRDV